MTVSGRVISLVPARLLDLLGQNLARGGHPIERRGRARIDHGTPYAGSDELVDQHFAAWSSSDHINFSSILETVRMLGERPTTILETGSSAWGINSSRLFDAYVASFGGEFWTVDIRIEPMVSLLEDLSPQSALVCDDSVRFLKRWVESNRGRRVDLVYLDSWDLEVGSPLPAAIHGLLEFLAVRPALRDGALLLVDDTPGSIQWFPEHMREAADDFYSRHGLLPGKGMLIDRCLESVPGIEKIHHRYQVLYRFG